MNKNLGQKILELRDAGYSYKQIIAELNCSSSVVSYHCGENQKEKTRQRTLKHKKANPLRTKFYAFLESKKVGKSISQQSPNIKRILKNKMFHFNRNDEYMFTLEQLMEKIGNSPKCYLTGKEIDLSKSRTYSLDHIIPRSKGGDNSLENCAIACSEANQAKSNLSLEEFISLCQSVVDNFK
jgi:CRISPR/Cas system Type II protein with McrA/HNH and RuvC-like nuclease domain